MEVDVDNGLTLAVMAWIFSTWNHEKAERETIGFWTALDMETAVPGIVPAFSLRFSIPIPLADFCHVQVLLYMLMICENSAMGFLRIFPNQEFWNQTFRPMFRRSQTRL